MYTDSIYDMYYIPPEVPSTNINEVLASKEFSELMDIIDKIKNEPNNNSEICDTEPEKPVANAAEGMSTPYKTPVNALADYVPDLFSFSKPQEEEIKFDLFESFPIDSMHVLDLDSDITPSRKRKSCFTDSVDCKRQRLWREAPELYV